MQNIQEMQNIQGMQNMGQNLQRHKENLNLEKDGAKKDQGILRLGAGQGDAERDATQEDVEHGAQVHIVRAPTTRVEGDEAQCEQAELGVGQAQGSQNGFKVSEPERPAKTPNQARGREAISSGGMVAETEKPTKPPNVEFAKKTEEPTDPGTYPTFADIVVGGDQDHQQQALELEGYYRHRSHQAVGQDGIQLALPVGEGCHDHSQCVDRADNLDEIDDIPP